MELELARRRALLTAALGFRELVWQDGRPAVASALARWLDSWSGVGAIVAGMHAQGFDIELKQFPFGWRANYYPVGTAHSVVLGTAYEPTPSRAVQRAAAAALGRESTQGAV